MLNLEEQLKELGYEKATHDSEENRILYFKNRYGFFDIAITCDKKYNTLYFNVICPLQDTPAFWLTKLRNCQTEMKKDYEILKETTEFKCKIC